MYLKVCGLTGQKQIEELDTFVDYVGFIFYPQSKRFIEQTPNNTRAKRIGVFVDASLNTIYQKIETQKLDLVQLHGSEGPMHCREVQRKTPVIKAFGVSNFFDFNQLISFEGAVDYFLFDTKTPTKGGSGIQFDWSILNRYNLSTPFFLSGGINKESVKAIKKIKHPKLFGVDINSQFEISPGNKDVKRIKTFLHELKN